MNNIFLASQIEYSTHISSYISERYAWSRVLIFLKVSLVLFFVAPLLACRRQDSSTVIVNEMIDCTRLRESITLPTKDEYLRIIAKFRHQPNVSDAHIEDVIKDDWDMLTDELWVDQFRTEIIPYEIELEDKETAQAVLECLEANTIWWGEDYGSKVVINVLRIDLLPNSEVKPSNLESRKDLLDPSASFNSIVFRTAEYEDLPFDARIRLAEELEANKQYAEAIGTYQDAISIAELREDEVFGLDSVYNRVGEIYHLFLGNSEEALRNYSRAMELNPGFFEPYNNRGILFLELGYFEQSVGDLNAAIALEPDDAAPYNNRARALIELGRIEEAIVDLEKAIQIQPDYVEAYNNLGKAYSSLRDYTKAETYFSKALELNPNHADTFYDLGIMFQDAGDFARAYDEYSKAILLKPDYADAYYNRGRISLNTADFSAAIADFTESASLTPNNPDSYEALGLTYIYLGMDEEASNHLHKALDLGTENEKILGLKQDVDSVLELSHQIAENPTNTELTITRAEKLLAMGFQERALHDYNQVVEIDPYVTKAYFGIALILLANGDARGAFENLELFLEYEPIDSPARAAVESLLKEISIDLSE